MDDQLLDGLADGTGVLQTVAAGAVGKYQVVEDGVAPDDQVLVEAVVLVGARPGTDYLSDFIGWFRSFD